MTDAQLNNWENLIRRSSRPDIEKWLPQLSDMARPSHPSSGQYTYLLSVCAVRIREIENADCSDEKETHVAC